MIHVQTCAVEVIFKVGDGEVVIWSTYGVCRPNTVCKLRLQVKSMYIIRNTSLTAVVAEDLCVHAGLLWGVFIYPVTNSNNEW